MRLRSLSLEGYRAFAERTDIELRPLTLLFGYNSVGKSALLRALRFVSDSVHPATTGPLDLDSRAVRQATFSDLHARQNDAPELAIGLAWEGLRAEWTIRDLPNEQRQVVERLQVWQGDQQIVARWEPEQSSSRDEADVYAVTGREPSTVRGTFTSLRPPAGWRSKIWESLDAALLALPDQVQWLTALRRVPERRETLRAEPKQIEHDGAGVVAMLAYDEKRRPRSFRRVVEWFERATRHTLTVRREEDQVGIQLSPLQHPSAAVSIVDTGEGMAQVLPVLALIARSAGHPQSGEHVLTIEHPELHLHPGAQVELARFLCETAAGNEPPSIVLETHSENLLLEVQLAVASGRLSPDRVAIYWVRQREDGIGMAERIELDSDGRLLNDRWPEGVFQEDIDQARKLVAVQRSRTSA